VPFEAMLKQLAKTILRSLGKANNLAVDVIIDTLRFAVTLCLNYPELSVSLITLLFMPSVNAEAWFPGKGDYRPCGQSNCRYAVSPSVYDAFKVQGENVAVVRLESHYLCTGTYDAAFWDILKVGANKLLAGLCNATTINMPLNADYGIITTFKSPLSSGCLNWRDRNPTIGYLVQWGKSVAGSPGGGCVKNVITIPYNNAMNAYHRSQALSSLLKYSGLTLGGVAVCWIAWVIICCKRRRSTKKLHSLFFKPSEEDKKPSKPHLGCISYQV
jgi:hypothetical protein